MLQPILNPRVRSPDDLAGGDRKRGRKALSCYDCRRRKVGCDRRIPSCGRCVKQGHADSCIYEATPIDATPGGEAPLSADGTHTSIRTLDSQSSQLASSLVGTNTKEAGNDVSSKLLFQANKIEQLEARLVSLEAAVKQRNEANNDLRLEMPAIDPIISPARVMVNGTQLNHHGTESTESLHFRGKGFKGQFYGASNPTSLISHVRVSSFVVRCWI